MTTTTRGARLRAVDPDEVADGLAAALDGGPPIAPLPADPAERTRALAALELDRDVPEPDAAVVVLTSGSTGRPKGVVLSRTAVRASAEATHARLGGPGEWLLALPSHYVAGLMVLARAHLAGAAVRSVGSDLAGLTDLPDAPARRYLSVVPTQLARALSGPASTAALARLDAVLVGGAPCPADLLARARRAGIPVVTTYGMSETCGGCVYDGVPLEGVSIDLADDDRVVVRGPVLFSGYRPPSAGSSSDAFATADRARWTDGRLEVLGRVDDVVISGGLNVDLAEVDRLSRTCPALDPYAELAVLGLPDPEWGTEVVAVTDGALTVEALRTHLGGLLPAYAAPRRVVRLDRLPHTSGGKIDRQRLRTLLDTRGAT